MLSRKNITGIVGGAFTLALVIVALQWTRGDELPGQLGPANGVQCIPICGDGVKDGGEDCDDGNQVNGDGCSRLCVTETACPPNACAAGGNTFCGLLGQGCQSTTTGACIQCGAAACNANTDYCQTGGTAFCAILGKTCANAGTNPCIVCNSPPGVQTPVGPGGSSSASAAWACPNNKCQTGGAAICALIQQSCFNTPQLGNPCITCAGGTGSAASGSSASGVGVCQPGTDYCTAGGAAFCNSMPVPQNCVNNVLSNICVNCIPKTGNGSSAAFSSNGVCPANGCQLGGSLLCSLQNQSCSNTPQFGQPCISCGGNNSSGSSGAGGTGCQQNTDYCAGGGTAFCNSMPVPQNCVNNTLSNLCINCVPKPASSASSVNVCPPNGCQIGGALVCSLQSQSCNNTPQNGVPCITCGNNPSGSSVSGGGGGGGGGCQLGTDYCTAGGAVYCNSLLVPQDCVNNPLSNLCLDCIPKTGNGSSAAFSSNGVCPANGCQLGGSLLCSLQNQSCSNTPQFGQPCISCGGNNSSGSSGAGGTGCQQNTDYCAGGGTAFCNAQPVPKDCAINLNSNLCVDCVPKGSTSPDACINNGCQTGGSLLCSLQNQSCTDTPQNGVPCITCGGSNSSGSAASGTGCQQNTDYCANGGAAFCNSLPVPRDCAINLNTNLCVDCVPKGSTSSAGACINNGCQQGGSILCALQGETCTDTPQNGVPCITCGNNSSGSSASGGGCLPNTDYCAGGGTAFCNALPVSKSCVVNLNSNLCVDCVTSGGGGSSGAGGSAASNMSTGFASSTGGAGSSAGASYACPATACADGGNVYCQLLNKTCRLDTTSMSCIACEGNENYVCTGNECTQGGNALCGKDNKTCVNTNSGTCIRCEEKPILCQGNECSTFGSAFCSAQGKTCKADSDSPSCVRCEGESDYVCKGNECGTGGDTFCNSKGTSCRPITTDICIECFNSDIECRSDECARVGNDYCSTLGKTCTADPSSPLCVKCDGNEQYQCLGNECALGGKAYCAAFGKSCVAGSAPSCIACVDAPLRCKGDECSRGGADYCGLLGQECVSDLAGATCIRCESEEKYECLGNECRQGGAEYCSAFGRGCRNVITGNCIECTPEPGCTNTSECLQGQACIKNVCVDLCGNGRLDAGEACDGGRGCSDRCVLLDNQQCTFDTECRTNLCVLNTCVPCTNGSQCQSGKCTAGICVNWCGNGRLDLGEICDPGTGGSSTTCTSACLRPAGVACATDQECQSQLCRDNVCAQCRSDAECGGLGSCVAGQCLNTCGDGILDPGEQCDDGNRITGDKCDRFCMRESRVLGELTPLNWLSDITDRNSSFIDRLGNGTDIGGVGARERESILRHLSAGQAPAGNTGPAAVMMIAGGAAAGWAWVKRRRR